jgi:hypothetical protein
MGRQELLKHPPAASLNPGVQVPTPQGATWQQQDLVKQQAKKQQPNTTATVTLKHKGKPVYQTAVAIIRVKGKQPFRQKQGKQQHQQQVVRIQQRGQPSPPPTVTNAGGAGMNWQQQLLAQATTEEILHAGKDGAFHGPKYTGGSGHTGGGGKGGKGGKGNNNNNNNNNNHAANTKGNGGGGKGTVSKVAPAKGKGKGGGAKALPKFAGPSYGSAPDASSLPVPMSFGNYITA